MVIERLVEARLSGAIERLNQATRTLDRVVEDCGSRGPSCERREMWERRVKIAYAIGEFSNAAREYRAALEAAEDFRLHWRLNK